MRQPQWDKYETALLIDTYWRVERGDLSRENGVAFLSQLLRKRAQTFGLEIDDTFRNTNGITMRLSSIWFFFTNGEKGIGAPSKLYKEMCELYLNDRKAFDDVLFAAKATNGNLSQKDLFELWLQLKYNAPTAAHYVRNVTKIDQYCNERKIIYSTLFGPNAMANAENAKQTIFNNKFFRIRFRSQIKLFEQAINLYCSFLEYCNKVQTEVANEYAIKNQQFEKKIEEKNCAEPEDQNAEHAVEAEEEVAADEINEHESQMAETFEPDKIEFDEIKPLAQSLDVQADDYNKNLIKELELSVRPFGVLKRNNIETVGELLQLSPAQLRSFTNMGINSVEEIQNKLYVFLHSGRDISMGNADDDGFATGMKPFNSFYFDEDQPLSATFNVPADEYEKVFITKLNLSVRPLGVLTRSNYQTVGELLKLSPAQLLVLPNMGVTSLQEIEKKLYAFLCAGDKQKINPEKHEKYSDSLKQAVRAYFNQETYDTSVLSDQEQSVYCQIIEHINDDNKELFKLALEQPESVVGVVNALNKFSYVYQRREKKFDQIIGAMDALDKEKKAKPLPPFLAAYNCKEKKEISFSIFSLQDTVGSMAKILYHHRDELTGFELSEYLNIAQWLQADDDTIRKFFYHTVETTFAGRSNELKFFGLRAAGKTLEEIAQENRLTRERVRQVESKASIRFYKLYAKFPYDLVMLASADFGGTSAVTFEQLETLSGEYTPLLWHCIKTQEKILKKEDRKISMLPYEYSATMDAILVDNKLSEAAQSLLSALPDIIIDSELESLALEQINDLDAETVRHIVEQNYTHIGKVFARVPITVSFMCDLVLKNCYKYSGVKITDETQNTQFKANLLEYFGSKAANMTPRAIEAKVGECGCLIDRGTYIHPDNLYIDVTTLSKIKEFIDNSLEQRVFFNDIFENLYRVLGKAGITNRYMLHGVVKKYFSEYKTTRDFVLKGHDSENQRESVGTDITVSNEFDEIQIDKKNQDKNVIADNRPVMNYLEFTLDAIPSLAGTKPVSITVANAFSISELRSWKDLYRKTFAKVLENHRFAIEPYIGKSLLNGIRIEIGTEADLKVMRSPAKVGEFYIETNHSSLDISKCVRALLNICGYQSENVKIIYISDSLQSNLKTQSKSSAAVTDEELFQKWLHNSLHYSLTLANRYAKTVAELDEFLKEHHIGDGRIFGASVMEINHNLQALYSSYSFSMLDSEKQHSFKEPLDKYIRYLERDYKKDFKEAGNNKTESKEEKSNNDNHLIEELLRNEANGLTKEEIKQKISTMADGQINRALVECHAVLVLKKYYHRDNISDYQEMADILLEVISKQFSQHGNYTSALQLYNEARLRLDDFFFYNNAFDSKQEVYDLAVHLFEQEKYKGNSFIFVNHMHIWKGEPDYPKDYHGLLIKYAREHGNTFSREEAIAYFEQIGSTTPAATFSFVLFNTGNKSFLQYAENQFVLSETITINDYFLASVSTQIDNLLEGEDYIATGEIDDYFYSTLPHLPKGIYWSALLLEDILRIYETDYTTIKASKDDDKKTIPAAIVRKKSHYRSFSDVVWNEVAKTFSLPKEFDASEFREFLLDKGFIRGFEKMWNVHKTVTGDIRFYWTDNNGKVTIN